MKVEERDFQADTIIDKDNLEGEWLEQASLYLYYAEAYSEAVYRRDKIKVKLEYCYAATYNKIKTNYDRYFDNKPTEAAIKERVILDSTYQKTILSLAKANKLVNDMAAAKTAMEHRKKALENLVQLKISGLYSEPKQRKRINQVNQTNQKGGYLEQKKSLNALNDKSLSGTRASTRLSRVRRTKKNKE